MSLSAMSQKDCVHRIALAHFQRSEAERIEEEKSTAHSTKSPAGRLLTQHVMRLATGHTTDGLAAGMPLFSLRSGFSNSTRLQAAQYKLEAPASGLPGS
jgi:hypothetical protein